MTDHAMNHLDEGIRNAVLLLRENGVETVESCEGGSGHAFLEPTVRFVGGKAEGYRALSIALQFGLKVSELRRVWPVLDYEPTGPYWELTFVPTITDLGHRDERSACTGAVHQSLASDKAENDKLVAAFEDIRSGRVRSLDEIEADMEKQ